MEIRKIAGIAPDDRAAVDEAFAGIEPLPVACCNWPAEFPYAPEVSFRMFHTGDWLMLRFDVAERYTAALVTEDNGEVWTDSCAEFFIAPDTGLYYNFETTCIGRMLLGARKSRTEAEHASLRRAFRRARGRQPLVAHAGHPPAGAFPPCADRLERSQGPHEPLQMRRQPLAPPFPLVAADPDGETRFPPSRVFRGGDVREVKKLKVKS